MDDEEAIDEIAKSVEGYLFSEIGRKEIEDYEINISFEEGVLDIEVYVNAPNHSNSEEVAEDAVMIGHEKAEKVL